MPLKPLNDRILIQRMSRNEMTRGGIIIPDTVKEKPVEGIVIAIADPKADAEPAVRRGERVLFGKFAGVEVSVDGEDYLLLSENEVLAVIEP